MRDAFRNLAFIAPILGLALVPVAAFGILTVAANDAQEQALRPTEPTVATVGSTLNESRQPVEITVTTQPAASATLSTSGTLTSLNIEPGSAVIPGMVLGTVNDVPVLAYTATVPLYRDLAEGNRGPDVALLQEFLASTGRDIGSSDGVFGSGTRDALRDLQRTAGLQITGTAQRSDFVWVPSGIATVGTIDAKLGQQVDGGAALFSGPDDVTATKITSANASSSTVTLPGGGQPVLVAGDQTFPLDSLTPSDEGLNEFLRAQADAGSLTKATTESTTVYRGASIADGAAAEIATAPAAALYVVDGATCVFVSADGEYQPVTVDNPAVVAGTLDTVTVPLELKGSHVALDPHALDSDVRDTCTSK